MGDNLQERVKKSIFTLTSLYQLDFDDFSTAYYYINLNLFDPIIRGDIEAKEEVIIAVKTTKTIFDGLICDRNLITSFIDNCKEDENLYDYCRKLVEIPNPRIFYSSEELDRLLVMKLAYYDETEEAYKICKDSLINLVRIVKKLKNLEI